MSFAPLSCPQPSCLFHKKSGGTYIKKGFFTIRRLNQRIRKYQCKSCRKIFSSRSFKADYKHKKMDLNFKLAQLLVEGNSLRSCSRLLGLTYKNTYRKFLWLKKVVGITKGQLKIKVSSIQFDELETIHHTKCKPLSIALVVSAEHELISAQVAEMPAKGRLSEISRKKYGPRKDERPEKLRQALVEAQSRSELEIVPLFC